MPKGVKLVVRGKAKKNVFWPSPEMKKQAHVSDPKIYETALKNPVKFWESRAKEGLSWFRPWKKAYEEKPPHFSWFLGAEINASYNCLDRHLPGKKDVPAVIWQPEPVNEKERIITYGQLHADVCRFANVLRSLGIQKGDRVSIYMPVIPEVMVAMLACTRIGAVHSVVFSAFSGESLKARILDSEAKVLVTCDGYWRRGEQVSLKPQADIGADSPSIGNVVVFRRTGADVPMRKGRDLWYHELMAKAGPKCDAVPVGSNETMFLLYTSGTTGKPKGVVHDTGGYLTQAYWTTLWDFDLHANDVFWCTADIGWITGHTYACYGPLLVGSTTLLYEGSPDFPDWGRIWGIIEKFKVSVFYTAPTAIRMFKKAGDSWVTSKNLSSLRLLGTVGEPIDNGTWLWYFQVVGGKRCPIIDTWWQTETGGTLINALPGVGPFIPTVGGRPFPGTAADIFGESGKPVKKGQNGYLVLLPPFPPGLLRGVWNNEEKYVETYWHDFGNRVYFTADGAKWFDRRNIRLTGRVDDVMKVAGHRLSSAEVEDALISHPGIIEAAVVPRPDELKGQVPVAFVILKHGFSPSDELKKGVIEQVKKRIGPTAKPSEVFFVDALPKTRSGKMMRRFLKSMLVNEKLGDSTTLQNPESIEYLKKVVGYKEK